ncbi:hypothetical protein [Streptomyces mangrovisoli]|uniref:UL36 very large tegument protein n=1 Tax=Streptomyces mangrovisoli TaxID=1428628 RepID=A0A1J4NS73_9ACTN|nr:hypothetical protein [Streptomyces mangrovisoli]OIJ64093.1 hypothetical protein WN71_030650 [Streptomyces mangrovisoli]
MTVEQLPGRVREFASYLDGLLARLDQGGGWCGIFWQRDPDGMQAYREGRDVPPWDVLEALLQDLATAYGTAAVAPEAQRARSLHAAALAVHDTRPGGREALIERLDATLREQRQAAERQAGIGRSLAAAGNRDEAESLRLDLAWARDDHERATARCAELRARIERLGHRATSAPAPGSRDIAATRSGEGATRPADGGPRAPQRPGERSARPADARPAMPRQRDAGSSPAGESAASGPDGGTSGPVRMFTWRDRQRAFGGDPDRVEEDDWSGQSADARGDRSPDRRGGEFPGARGGDFADPRGGDFPDTRGTARPGFGGAGGHDSAPGGVAPAPALTGSVPVAPVSHRAVEPGDPADFTAPDELADPFDPEQSAPKQRRRRRVGARFAGLTPEAAADGDEQDQDASAARRGPRGPRFSVGGARSEPRALSQAAEPAAAVPQESSDAQVVAQAVATLVRLRGEGRTGEAHALLVEAAHWPAARLPLLAAELDAAGLGAEWVTLLWEAASLPAENVVAAADELVAAGRAADGQQILRQGVVRPAEEIGAGVLALLAEGRMREVRALLDAYVRVRTPEEAARSVAADPQRLVPLLLEAAKDVSDVRHWDLLHALRVAGHTA